MRKKSVGRKGINKGTVMQGGRLPEIHEYCAHAVGLETIEMEYEVFWYAFGHILTVEKAEDRQVSMGMNRELKWQQQNH